MEQGIIRFITAVHNQALYLELIRGNVVDIITNNYKKSQSIKERNKLNKRANVKLIEVRWGTKPHSHRKVNNDKKND
jgi:hypothetical protein